MDEPEGSEPLGAVSVEELSSYVYGELNAEEEARLLARCEKDADAAAKLEIMRNLDSLIAQHPAAQGRVDDPEPMAEERFARIEAKLRLWEQHRVGHGGSLPDEEQRGP